MGNLSALAGSKVFKKVARSKNRKTLLDFANKAVNPTLKLFAINKYYWLSANGTTPPLFLKPAELYNWFVTEHIEDIAFDIEYLDGYFSVFGVSDTSPDSKLPFYAALLILKEHNRSGLREIPAETETVADYSGAFTYTGSEVYGVEYDTKIVKAAYTVRVFGEDDIAAIGKKVRAVRDAAERLTVLSILGKFIDDYGVLLRIKELAKAQD